MKNRADFIGQYPECSVEDYLLNTVPEFEKIIALPIDCEITCWFEDDLFCQVNFWFVIHLLVKKGHKNSIYLVRPNAGNEYSFANMTEAELKFACQNKLKLLAQPLVALAQLWPLYQQDDIASMRVIAKQLIEIYPFL